METSYHSMKIAVFGNFGVHNLGDDLILMGLQEDLKELQPELTVFCGAPEKVEEQSGLTARHFFPGGLRSWILWLMFPSIREEVRESRQILSQMDRVIIGGGGILVDRHPKAILLWWAQLREIQRSGTPYHLVANSIELKYDWSKKLLLPYLKGAEKITVRDRASKELLKDLGISASIVEDLAMKAPLPPVQRTDRAQVALAFCRWSWTDQALQDMRLFLAVLKAHEIEVVALAFQTDTDDDRTFYQLLDPSLRVVSELEEVVQELSSSQLLLGMRLHSIILAERLQKPFIAIPYQEKVRAYVTDLGLEHRLLEMADLKLKRLQALFEKIVEGEGE